MATTKRHTDSKIELAEKILLAICPSYVQVHAAATVGHLRDKMEGDMRELPDRKKQEYVNLVRKEMIKTCSKGVVEVAFAIADEFRTVSGQASMMEHVTKSMEVNLGNRPRL
jgi:hypothetical protein